jgi:hypothetical protein
LLRLLLSSDEPIRRIWDQGRDKVCIYTYFYRVGRGFNQEHAAQHDHDVSLGMGTYLLHMLASPLGSPAPDACTKRTSFEFSHIPRRPDSTVSTNDSREDVTLMASSSVTNDEISPNLIIWTVSKLLTFTLMMIPKSIIMKLVVNIKMIIKVVESTALLSIRSPHHLTQSRNRITW